MDRFWFFGFKGNVTLYPVRSGFLVIVKGTNGTKRIETDTYENAKNLYDHYVREVY